MLGVLCAGRVYCDLVLSGLQQVPKPGTEIYADKLSMHAGGGAAISSHYFAMLGHPTQLCANFPAAPFSEIIRDELDGVGLQHCSTEENADPQITVVLTGTMDRSFVTRRAGSALPKHYRNCIEQLSNTKAISHLHISELATLLEYPDLIALARSANWTVSLDCAWDSDAMASDTALSLIESCDVFLPNEAEFEQLQTIGIATNIGPLLVIKKGAAGATAYGKHGYAEAPAAKTNCVDATGAGDAFNAGFIHAWLQRQVITDCLESGNRCGARAVQQLGGITP